MLQFLVPASHSLALAFAICVHFFLAIACADSTALAVVVAQTANAEAVVATLHAAAIVAAFAVPPDDFAHFVSAADDVATCVFLDSPTAVAGSFATAAASTAEPVGLGYSACLCSPVAYFLLSSLVAFV